MLKNIYNNIKEKKNKYNYMHIICIYKYAGEL